MKTVEIYCKGIAEPNPGYAGWCALLSCEGKSKLVSGGVQHATNNQMELTAAIEGLKALKEPCSVTLYSNSTYLTNLSTGANLDLWDALIPLVEEYRVTLIHMKKADNTLEMSAARDRAWDEMLEQKAQAELS